MIYDLILFDLDDTLLDFAKARDHSLAKVLTHVAPELDHTAMATRFHLINNQLWKDLEGGRVSKNEVLEGRFGKLFGEFQVEFAAASANAHFLDGLSEEAFLLDDATRLVAALSQQVPLGIISNGHGPTQRKRLSRAGLQQYFRFTLISDDVGQAKPHPEIFHRALALANLPKAERVLMIGDNLDTDIRGAQAVGFDTCWLNPHDRKPGALRPTFVAKTLAEVATSLGV